MKKLLTFLGIISFLLVLSGCSSTAVKTYTEPSFVGLSIDGQNPNNGTELVTYYKEKNESIMVAIELSNPDDLEIRGIVIKDYTYGKSKFTEESTNSMIYFTLDPGDDIGLFTFDLTDINFFDGADSRDVIVDSNNNEFNVYVYKDEPTAARENYSLSQDKIQIDFNINDIDEVIEEDTLIIELLSDGNIISSEIVTAGFVSIEFDNLLTDKMYEIKVRADYNIDDNTGDHEEVVLFNGTFTTLPTILPSAVLGEITIGSTDLTFDVTFKDVDSVTTTGGVSVQLLKDDVVVKEVQITGESQNVVFDGLFNTTEYEVKVVSDYNLRDGGGVKTGHVLASSNVTTLSRSVPVPLIENVVVETNRILFDVIVQDDMENPIIDITTLQALVYIEGVLERTVDISSENVDIQIYDILAGKDVYIELVADYDLFDGNGIQLAQVIHVIEYESLLNSRPESNVNEITVTQGYVKVDVSLRDTDNTLSSEVAAVLYENGVEVGRVLIDVDTVDFTFKHLVEYTKNYRVEVIADYNLRDGNGNKVNQILYTQALTSLVPKAPAAEIQNITTSTEGFEFEVIVMDADATLEDNTLFVAIMKDGVEKDRQALVVGLNTYTNNMLLSNNEYEVVILGDYNIQDGSGILTNKTLLKQSIITLPKELPTLLISNTSQTVDSVKLNINITDASDVLEPGSISAILYQNGVAVGVPYPLVVGLNAAVEFTGILSNTEYVIDIVADFDLDDAQGIITDYSLGEINLTTSTKQDPEAEIENIDEVLGTNESIKFDVIVIDPDSVIIPGSTKALLFVGDTATGHEVVLNSGLNAGVQFDNVYSNQEFNIRIVTNYNLNDGAADFEDVVLAYDFAVTGVNDMVIASINSVTSGIDSLTFDATVTDLSSVVTGNLKAILLVDDVPTGAEIPLVVGSNTGLVFSGLNSDSEYTIQLLTDYSLRDIAGEILGEELDSFTTSTDDYSAPTGYIINTIRTFDSLQFNTVISDTNNTAIGATPFVAALYLDDVATGHTQDVHVGESVNILFDNLYSGREYEIRIYADYDLHDGVGVQNDILIFDEPFETQYRLAPVGEFANDVITEDLIHLDFTYSDIDETMIPSSLKAWLYDEDGILVSSKSLFVDEVAFDISFLSADYQITVCVTADYDLKTGLAIIDDGEIICSDFTTYVNTVPTVGITNPVVNQTTVTVDISVDDTDLVIVDNLVAKLFDANHVLVDTQAINLGSNAVVFNATIREKELYNIVVSADYNLRDRQGTVIDTIFAEDAIMAFNKVIPQASISSIVSTVDTIDFDVNILDMFTTYQGNAKAVLYKDGVFEDEFILGVGDTSVTFDTLVSNAEYEVRVVIDYDNGSGNGVVLAYNMLTQAISTTAKQVPSALLENSSSTSSTISVDVTAIDIDGVVTGGLRAVLYKDGLPTLQTEDLVVSVLETVTFTLLDSDSEYEVRVLSNYDLADGVTVVTAAVIAQATYSTDINVAPTAAFTNVVVDKSSITFSTSVTDVDAVITGSTKAVLIKNGIEIDEILLPNPTHTNEVFTGLNSDSVYTVVIRTNYNLKDGAPTLSNVTLATNNVNTLINSIPTALAGNASSDTDSITFDVIVTDTDSVITTNLQAVLYKDGLPTGFTEALSSVVANTGISFTGLLSNSQYEVRIVTDYNVNDGDGEVTGYPLANLTQTTTSKVIPTGVISNVTVTNSVIEFDVVIEDSTSTIVGTPQAVLYKDGVAEGTPIDLGVATYTDQQFTDLEFGVEYEVKIETSYNDNLGNADITGFELATVTTTTQALVTVESLVEDIDEVSFDIILDDEFGILDNSNMYLYLYSETDDFTAVVASYAIQGSGSVDLLNFLNDHTYRVIVKSDVTSTGTKDIVYEQDIEVPARELSTVILDPITITSTSISTAVSIELPDTQGIIVADSVVAYLYQLNVDGVTWDYVADIDLLNAAQPDYVIDFTGLTGVETGNVYKITLKASVDFNDGEGVLTDYEFHTRTFIYTP